MEIQMKVSSKFDFRIVRKLVRINLLTVTPIKLRRLGRSCKDTSRSDPRNYSSRIDPNSRYNELTIPTKTKCERKRIYLTKLETRRDVSSFF